MSLDVPTALRDPHAVFDRPQDVLAAAIGDDVKLEILRRWEVDARELAVAEEENMAGGEPNLLAEVGRALEALGADHAGPRGPAKG